MKLVWPHLFEYGLKDCPRLVLGSCSDLCRLQARCSCTTSYWVTITYQFARRAPNIRHADLISMMRTP